MEGIGISHVLIIMTNLFKYYGISTILNVFIIIFSILHN